MIEFTEEDALKHVLAEFPVDVVLDVVAEYGPRHEFFARRTLPVSCVEKLAYGIGEQIVYKFSAIEVLRAHVARLQEKAKVADFREIFDRNRERIYAENPTPHSTRVGEIKGSVIVPDTED